jgi:hypothetical protein
VRGIFHARPIHTPHRPHGRGSLGGTDPCPVYYAAREAAMKNRHLFHLAAFTKKRGGPIGVNQYRGTAKFRKRYHNSREFYYERHAEVDLILKMRVIPEKIFVMRFLETGKTTMARPCVHCQNFLKHKGVKVVRYTNWEGDWEEMKL